jgi:hypothetical protein
MPAAAIPSPVASTRFRNLRRSDGLRDRRQHAQFLSSSELLLFLTTLRHRSAIEVEKSELSGVRRAGNGILRRPLSKWTSHVSVSYVRGRDRSGLRITIRNYKNVTFIEPLFRQRALIARLVALDRAKNANSAREISVHRAFGTPLNRNRLSVSPAPVTCAPRPVGDSATARYAGASGATEPQGCRADRKTSSRKAKKCFRAQQPYVSGNRSSND